MFKVNLQRSAITGKISTQQNKLSNVLFDDKTATFSFNGDKQKLLQARNKLIQDLESRFKK